MKLSFLSGNRPAWHKGFIIVLLSLSFQFTSGSMKSVTKYSDPDNSFSNEVDGDEGDDGVCMKDESQTCLRKKFYSTVRYQVPVVCSYLDVPYNYTEDEYERMVKEDAFSEDFDLRKEYQIKCPSIIEISNQGSCESCWAVAATDVMTDRLCIMSQGAIKRRHSVADLLTCCKDCTFELNRKLGLGLCGEGGSQKKAWMYWVQKGIASGHYKHQTNTKLTKGCRGYDIQPCVYISREEWDQKYGKSANCTVDLMHCPKVTTQPVCEDICDESEDQSKSNHLLKGQMCYKLNRQFDGKENLIKAEIKKNGPVHAFMTVYKSFYKHFSETINEDSIYLGDPEKDDLCPGGHSIRIVGWGKKNGRNYWIAANSWGEKWGLNGFFHLDFNHDKELGSAGGKNLMYAGIPEFE